MTMRDQIKALQAENDALRAEAAALRAHVCPVPAVPQTCLCGPWNVGGINPPPCPAHGHVFPWQQRGGGCAPGAAEMGWQTYTVNAAGANPAVWISPLPGAANACAGAVQSYWVNT